MVGDRILRYLKTVPPRQLPKLNLFLSFLSGKIREGTSRASFSPNNSNGVRLLTQIIKLSDIDTLVNTTTNKRNIGQYLLTILSDLEKPIDIRTGVRTSQSLFVRTKSPCFELLTPSRRKNPLGEIPVGAKYDSQDWKNIKPLRIVDMGPCDLTFKVFESRLDYYGKGPSNVIYALDCFALVAKFVAYYKYKNAPDDMDQCIQDFLHYEVIVPTLLNDSTSIWLRNVYRRQFLSDSRLVSLIPTMADNIDIDTLGTEFSGAMIDVLHLKTDMSQESISGLTALSSLPLTVEGVSFIDYYRELYNTTRLPETQPYIWVECLKNWAYWDLVLLTASFTPSLPETVSFLRDLTRDVRFWIMIKPWNEIPQSFRYKQTVKQHLESIYHWLKTV